MITLKIKNPGYTLDIPGLPTCRSPVQVDISKLDIRVVAMSLKNAGIAEYEIVADIGEGVKEVYTKSDFEIKEERVTSALNVKAIDEKFSKLEKMLSLLLEQKQGSYISEKEQITNKLDKLEKLISERSLQSVFVKDDNFEPEIEEMEAFIPEIDTSGMTIESKNLKTIEQDSEDLDDASDILSGLIKKK